MLCYGVNRRCVNLLNSTVWFGMVKSGTIRYRKLWYGMLGMVCKI